MQGLKIHHHISGHDLPMDLLFLADPSLEMIEGYLHQCEVFIATLNDEEIACYALLAHDKFLIEIKNLSVRELYQRKGIGTILINDAIEKARALGYQKIRLCTGNSSLRQLHLYQKLGFNKVEVLEGFFRDNYSDPIFENGMECVDLIVLEKMI